MKNTSGPIYTLERWWDFPELGGGCGSCGRGREPQDVIFCLPKIGILTSVDAHGISDLVFDEISLRVNQQAIIAATYRNGEENRNLAQGFFPQYVGSESGGFGLNLQATVETTLNFRVRPPAKARRVRFVLRWLEVPPPGRENVR